MPTPLTVAASWLRTPRPEQPAARTTRHRTRSRRRTLATSHELDDDNAQAYRRGGAGCENAPMTSYQPADGRYDTMLYRRVGRSGLPAARDLPRAVAELRRRPAAGDPAGDRAPRLRPRHHPLRPGQQLRAALRLGRGELRPRPRHRPARPPGRAGDLDQGRLRHVAGPLRRPRLAQISPLQLDQSLARMGLPYVDIFYSHRVDPDTPIEETMGRGHRRPPGKALYAGISSYSPERTRQAAEILRGLGTPLLIHQPSYSMLNRWIEDDGLLNVLEEEGAGCIVFSLLAQGLLTDRYLDGVPEGSRASRPGSLGRDQLSEATLAKVRALHELARRRGQSLAQLAIAWALRDPRVTSACSARPASPSSRRTWPPSTTSTSTPTSWPRSTGTPPRPASTSGSRPAGPSSPPPGPPRPPRWPPRGPAPGARCRGSSRRRPCRRPRCPMDGPRTSRSG